MAITDTIDWNAALKEFLDGEAYVTDEVGTKIFVRNIPKGGGTPGKALVLVQSGGGAAIRLPIVTCEYRFRCYGDTAYEAREVYRGLRSALHGVKRKRITPGTGVSDSGTHWLIIAKETGSPQDVMEPETDWNFVLCQFWCMFFTFPVSA